MSLRIDRVDVHGIAEHEDCPDPHCCACECGGCRHAWFESSRPNPETCPTHRVPGMQQGKEEKEEDRVGGAVLHPRHYNSHPSGIEAIDLLEDLGFNLGNALKYLFRKDHKGLPVQDMKKALFYLRREHARTKDPDYKFVFWPERMSEATLVAFQGRFDEFCRHEPDTVLRRTFEAIVLGDFFGAIAAVESEIATVSVSV